MASSHAQIRSAPPKVLVVEDEAGLRFIISDVLVNDHGFDVIEAASGDQALDVLEHDNAIKCVFTDVRMPGDIDGIALSRRILKDHPGVKILVTSGHLFTSEGHLSSEGLGGVPFVAKPYNLTHVADMIQQLIDSLGPAAEPK